jgi:hypothetical protein
VWEGWSGGAFSRGGILCALAFCLNRAGMVLQQRPTRGGVVTAVGRPGVGDGGLAQKRAHRQGVRGVASERRGLGCWARHGRDSCGGSVHEQSGPGGKFWG